MSDQSQSLPAPAKPRWPATADGVRRADLSVWPVPLAAAVALAGALILVWRSFGHKLWLDELYTTTLIDTPSLFHVWDGATRGIDGSPPLYFSIAWALTQAIPAEPERVLRLLNLMLLAATARLLFSIGRRLADPVSVAVGLAILCAVHPMVDFALLEVRTYALYLMLATATLWATLRLEDRPSAGRTAALAAAGALTALAHSFGGFFVAATIGPAMLVSAYRRDPRRLASLGLAAVPALAITAAWTRFYAPVLLAVSTPYGWILPPDLETLAAAIAGSVALLPLPAAAILVVAWRCRSGLGALSRCCLERPDVATLFGSMAAYGLLTLAGWVGSQLITPFFVDRYFIPNVTTTSMLIVAAVGFVRPRVRGPFRAALVGIAIASGFGGFVLDRDDAIEMIPCRDSGGGFVEDAAAAEGLPVVVESPHAWLPRERYASERLTLYPLDWDVVRRYPDRAPNNAVDYHIMAALRDWAGPGTHLGDRILDTATLLDRYRRFLVLDEANRAWFANLRLDPAVSATVVTRRGACTLWRVELDRGGGGAVRQPR